MSQKQQLSCSAASGRTISIFGFALRSALLFSCTVGAGWMYGSMTNRWGTHFDSQLAAQQLEQPLPERVGEIPRSDVYAFDQRQIVTSTS